MSPRLEIVGIRDLPDIRAGDDLAELTASALVREGLEPRDGDVFVFAQKIVSKSEDRIVALDSVTPSPLAVGFASQWNRDPRHIEVVLRQAKRIVKMERGVLIIETAHGLVCAHGGVDASNLERPDTLCLLPVEPDASAERLRIALETISGKTLAVVVSDTFGRPWREGQTNVAIGVSGMQSIIDYRGRADSLGRTLDATQIAVADEIAAAAELVMGKLDRVPVALVRGLVFESRAGTGAALIRPKEMDLFR